MGSKKSRKKKRKARAEALKSLLTTKCSPILVEYYLLKNDVIPQVNESIAWKKFINQYQVGDEIWLWDRGGWEVMAGRSGYAIVRQGEVVDLIVTAMN